MRKCATLALAFICSACVTTETVSFKAQPGQQAIIRDGIPALTSRKPSSLVVIRPASRQIPTRGRPVFAVGIYNLDKQPLNFLIGNIRATQVVNGQTADLRVITYEDLVREEQTRQVFAALATGLAAGANSYSASRAGHYNSSSTIYTPRGTYRVHTAGYSPTANAIARANANAQNEEMISAAIEQGQANLAALERGVMKDNTILPGEWYGGQLHLQPLMQETGAKTYSIVLNVGPDRHEIEIAQDTLK